MYRQLRTLALASAIALTLVSISSPIFAATAQEITNARQEGQIFTAYALSPYLRADNIAVTVDNGKATLTGNVEGEVNKDLATQIAQGTKGITEVDNQIVVMADYAPQARGEDRSFGDVIDDASITAAKAYAGSLATNTRGVRSVDNQLVLDTNKPRAETTAAQDVADTWITAKIKSSYMYSDRVDGSDIEVNTKDGHVTLRGKLNSGAEQALAIELAQNVRGVKDVTYTGLSHSM